MHAAIYCRSSKDRAEVGLETQRSELRAFAKGHALVVAAEFSDMEISGSLDEVSRPGLHKMLTALRDPARAWSTLLALDTSRIARDPALALFVTREAEKVGVTIQYAKMPIDGSTAFGETMLGVVRAFDRLHARMSAEKGRSGLMANISKGFRAGGAAPFGYKLKHEETGATRGGVPVRKSRLALDAAPAKKVQAFLKARAAGETRVDAARKAKMHDKAVASLIAIERNALTYAGLTVWNQRVKVKPTRDNPRRTMEWRPRHEWMITDEPTHEALITRDEAERCLASVGRQMAPRPRVRNTRDFLLTGLLFTPEGVQWHGDSHDSAYRAGSKGRRVNAPWIEGEVLCRVAYDFADPAFLTRVVDEARRLANSIEADPQVLAVEIRREEKRLANVLELAAENGTKSLIAKIRQLEQRLDELREQHAAWTERAALKRQLLAIDEAQVRGVLAGHGVELVTGEKMLDVLGDEKHRMPAGELRQILSTLLERVELNPKTRQFTIRYRLPVPTETRVAGVKVASPRGFEPRLPP
jgi:putative DNA-invertase from lambdoid prophage Rac